MTAIAREIEEALAKMDPQTAEQLTRNLRATLATVKPVIPPTAEVRRKFEIPSHSFGIKSGTDFAKFPELCWVNPLAAPR